MANYGQVMVPFAEAEQPLIEAALVRQPLPPLDSTHDDIESFKRFWNYGEVARNIKNGWIFFKFPLNSEQPTIRGNVQVWTGYSRSFKGDTQLTKCLQASFDAGIIDEDKVLLEINLDRMLQAHRENFYSGHDPTMPAYDLLQQGIAWIIGRVADLESHDNGVAV